MRKILLSILALTMGMSMQAQSNLDVRLNHAVQMYKMDMQQAMAKGMDATSATQKKITVIGTLKDGQQTPKEELEALGVKVVNELYGLVYMELSIDKLEALSQLKAFRVINANNEQELKNKQSHICTHVTEVQNANNLPEGLKQTYTGKGVIVGVIDGGIDFNNKNFKTADGTSRVKKAWIHGTPYDTPEAIDTLKTDSDENTHGTHTAGTAAGSYAGEYKHEDGTVLSGYQGVAYDSDLLLYATTCKDTDVQSAISKMWDYAKNVAKKPLAVNISLGGNDAWMDGKNTYTTFFKNITKNGTEPGLVINVSAGNEGLFHNSMYKRIEANDSITTAIELGGEIMICSDDTTSFDVSIDGYKNGEIAKTYNLTEPSGKLFLNYSYTKGTSAEHDGRFYVLIDYGGDDFREKFNYYSLTIKAKDKPCNIRLNANVMKSSRTLGYEENEGWVTPNDDSSLNHMIQCKYAFAVGAYVSTKDVMEYEGGIDHATGDSIGAIAEFSSWVDVPYKGNKDSIGVDFLAPGSLVVSSMNSYQRWYVKAVVAKADDETSLCVMEGTSMAAPNATGIMALWLQACPTLCTNDIREIVKATADNDNSTLANVRRSGYGKINCLKGLQKILKDYNPSGITNVNADEDTNADRKYIENGRIIIQKNGKKYNIQGQQI